MEKYKWPIEPKYKVAEHDKYGIRKNHYVLFKERFHAGFDITADIGTEVHPILSGKVLLAEFDGTTTEGFDAFNDGYGNKVEILNDDGKRVVYGHLREILVKPGDIVTQNTVIGRTGSSGGSRVPHLHLEIRKYNTEDTGKEVTINPLEVLPKEELDKLDKQFTQEPYASLWRILVSDNPWGFKEDDIPYSESKEYIK
jgi:murein DD-endopeptidase MepM/ murein hydrolase activator NlpD